MYRLCIQYRNFEMSLPTIRSPAWVYYSLAIAQSSHLLLQRYPPPPGMQPGSNARADMLRRLTAGGAAGLTACTLVLLSPLFPPTCMVGPRFAPLWFCQALMHHALAVACSLTSR